MQDVRQAAWLVCTATYQLQLLNHIVDKLRFSSMKDLSRIGLNNWLEAFLAQLNEIAESIHHTYLEAQ